MFRAMTARELAQPESSDRGSPGSAQKAQPSSSRGPERSPLAARYRSLFMIGRGGMGSVEAALAIEAAPSSPDLEAASAPNGDRGYERIVALKRLLPDAARDK